MPPRKRARKTRESSNGTLPVRCHVLAQAVYARRQGSGREANSIGVSRAEAASASYMRREAPDHTLQTTGLVHEAYLKLVASGLQIGKAAPSSLGLLRS